MTEQADTTTTLPIRHFRDSFPGAAHCVYMDVAARGLISTEVRAAIDTYLTERMEIGGNKPAMFAAVEEARSQFAHLINAQADEVAFTKNVSDGINAVANAIDWKAGDNVILYREIEHPSNIYPWLCLRDRLGIEIRFVETGSGEIDPDTIISLMDDRTRMVTASSVSFAPGYRTDLDTIGQACRERDIFFLVDGAQSVGILHTDVAKLPIDALTVATQKGLLGLYGMGFLYVRAEWAERMMPVYLSRFSVSLEGAHEASMGDDTVVLAPAARRFEVGNYNYIGAVSACASIRHLLAFGAPAIEDHVYGLTCKLADTLLALDLPVYGGPSGPHLAHMVTLGHGLCGEHDQTRDEDMKSLHAFLEQNDIHISIRRGLLRFSLHAYNSEDDVEHVGDLARDWIKAGRAG